VRVVSSGARGAGDHTAIWDGRDDAGQLVPSGLYFVRLDHDGRRLVQRVVTVK